MLTCRYVHWVRISRREYFQFQRRCIILVYNMFLEFFFFFSEIQESQIIYLETHLQLQFDADFADDTTQEYYDFTQEFQIAVCMNICIQRWIMIMITSLQARSAELPTSPAGLLVVSLFRALRSHSWSLCSLWLRVPWPLTLICGLEYIMIISSTAFVITCTFLCCTSIPCVNLWCGLIFYRDIICLFIFHNFKP